MAAHEIKLIEKKEVAVGTTAFIFEKPAGYVYKAGQNTDWTLIDPPENDAEGNTRPFSFSSAPSEDHLMLTTRMRDTAFKRVLGAMPVGASLTVDDAMGSMTLQNDVSRPAVMLAGGIGITPFRSMVVEATLKKLPHKIFVFYSNRKPADAPFLRELMDLQNENLNYHMIATMTDADEDSWDRDTGYIDAAMLEKYLSNVLAPIYYLAGPPSMVGAMRKLLNGLSVNDDNIRSEEFSGY
jgi:ferredoxin-NADP reductase